MALTKQAKVLTKQQIKAILSYLKSSRAPDRNKVIFLLSVKAGFRAKEIAGLNWSMITDCEGHLADSILLDNSASKGSSGGRVIPINNELKEALAKLLDATAKLSTDQAVILSERGIRMSAGVLTNWFDRLYKSLGFEGCSSHSGRRTFITNAAKVVSSVGGSLRDVQTLAGHSSLNMTQKYIENDTNAQQKLVQLI